MKPLYPKFWRHLFSIATVFFLLILFLLFHPSIPFSIAYQLHPPTVNAFLDESIQNDVMNTQDFWKVREFYSRGSFLFSRSGLKNVTIGVPYFDQITNQGLPDPFLIFKSPLWQSADYLVSRSSLEEIAPNIKNGCIEYLLNTKDDLICKVSDQSLRIAFIRQVDSMKVSVGFFDYNGQDKEIVKNLNWFSISHITYE